MDKISHGGPADGAITGTSDALSSNNNSAVNSDAEGEYSDSENIDGEDITAAGAGDAGKGWYYAYASICMD